MVAYAEASDLPTFIQSQYLAFPAIVADEDADFLLLRASELIDEYTLNFAPQAYADEEGDTETPQRDALKQAACEQVEFWLEVGPEHDVAGLRGSLVAGRLQVHPVAKTLGPVPHRTLRNAGLIWAGTAVW